MRRLPHLRVAAEIILQRTMRFMVMLGLPEDKRVAPTLGMLVELAGALLPMVHTSLTCGPELGVGPPASAT